MISDRGWEKFCIWEHSATVRELYARRCRKEEPEMDAAAQAAELLAPHVAAGESVLDAGCGSGYFYHSLQSRNIGATYSGIDAAPTLIAIGQREMPAFGLPAERLQTIRIEDLDCDVDHTVCINVLSNIDNYHRPLERLLRGTRKTLVLRESCAEQASYQYVEDKFLDPGVQLNVHVNTYQTEELMAFIRSYGFDVTAIPDRRTQGQPEMVIGYPHHWKFFKAVRSR